MEFQPLGLMAYRQFIIYRLQAREGGGNKNDKIPVNVVTGAAINPLDPRAWMSFEEAKEFLKMRGSNHGIGFVFTKKDPFFLIDIDDCLLQDRTWNPLAQSLCSEYPDSLVEISSSGRGLHIIGSASAIPEHACKGLPGTGLELYHENRFVALTGMGMRGDAARDVTSQLLKTIEQHFKPKTSAPGQIDTLTDAPCEGWAGHLNDDDLINHALNMDSRGMAGILQGKARFRDLWENNVEVLAKNYPKPDGTLDESSADMALAGILAWMTGKDGQRMIRLMARSALNREKWHTNAGYLPNTVIKACQSCRSEPFVLKAAPPPKHPVQVENTDGPQPIGGDGFLSLENQKVLFKDCTYIQDLNGVLVPGGEILTQDQFRVIYGGFKFIMELSGEGTSKNAWEAFTQNRAYRYPRAHQTCFRPGVPFGTRFEIEGRQAVNMYVPAGIPRVQGDPAPFLDLVKRLFPVAEEREIILAYAAALVQYQGKKFTWCPYIQGTEGNGKTVFAKCIERAIGRRYSHTVPAGKLGGTFNDWFENKTYIIIDDFHDVDEIVFEILKPYITSERLEIEGKNKKKYMADICANFLITSNHKGAIPITSDSRRFAPIFTGQQCAEDKIRDGLTDEFFTRLHDWLENQNGYGIVAEFLYTYDIPLRYNPALGCFTAPRTQSTAQACIESRHPVLDAIEEAIAEARPGFRDGWISSIAVSELLAKEFRHKRYSRRLVAEMIESLGYVLHPELKNGRANRIPASLVVGEAGQRPKLYIRKDHKDRKLDSRAAISAYIESQK